MIFVLILFVSYNALHYVVIIIKLSIAWWKKGGWGMNFSRDNYENLINIY
jgi:hypothetical protein